MPHRSWRPGHRNDRRPYDPRYSVPPSFEIELRAGDVLEYHLVNEKIPTEWTTQAPGHLLVSWAYHGWVNLHILSHDRNIVLAPIAPVTPASLKRNGTLVPLPAEFAAYTASRADAPR